MVRPITWVGAKSFGTVGRAVALDIKDMKVQSPFSIISLEYFADCVTSNYQKSIFLVLYQHWDLI